MPNAADLDRIGSVSESPRSMPVLVTRDRAFTRVAEPLKTDDWTDQKLK